MPEFGMLSTDTGWMVAYQLDQHSCGSSMMLVFNDLAFDDRDETAAAKLLLETEFAAHGHIAFQPHRTQLITVLHGPDQSS
jgi:hypothetical protein